MQPVGLEPVAVGYEDGAVGVTGPVEFAGIVYIGGITWVETTGTTVELGTGTLAEPQLKPTLWMPKLQVSLGAFLGTFTVTLSAPPH